MSDAATEPTTEPTDADAVSVAVDGSEPAAVTERPPQAADGHEEGHDDSHEAAHHPNYWAIFLALCGLTAVSWLLDESLGWGLLSSRRVLAVLVLGVALAKALFVAIYFMHLKFEGRWKYVLLTPTMILAIGLPIALAPDLSLQYYPADTAQTRYLKQLKRDAATSVQTPDERTLGDAPSSPD